jgi:hypothetical protein
MRCPYCGDRRTEVLRTVYRGPSSYRNRRCLYCGSRFSTQERPVRWSRVERKWSGTCPSRNGWKKHRVAALQGRCEVESCDADFKQAGVHRHVDHIVPARLIRRLRAGNADRRENLQCICGTCHGYTDSAWATGWATWTSFAPSISIWFASDKRWPCTASRVNERDHNIVSGKLAFAATVSLEAASGGPS